MAAQQKALFATRKGGPLAVGVRDVPQPARGALLVKVAAAALNPVDWKVQDSGMLVPAFPAVLGMDCAGVVEALGPGVQGFRVGDRVLHHGDFNNAGATFQEYTLSVAELTAKIPAALSFDAAATIPLALATAAAGLHRERPVGLGLAPGWEARGRGAHAGEPFFVHGGASSVGQFVIQLARLCGFAPVIAAASPAHTALLAGLGATHVLDRHLPAAALVAAARELAAGAPIACAYDAVALPDTQAATRALVAPGGGVIVTQQVQAPEADAPGGRDVFVSWTYGPFHAADSRALGVSLFGALGRLLEEGLIKPNAVEVLPGGLAGIPEGLQRLRENKVSGKKLVVRPQETL